MRSSRAALGIAQLRPAQVTSLSSLTACGEVAAGLRVEVGHWQIVGVSTERLSLIPLFPSPLENLSLKFLFCFKKLFILFWSIAE